MYCESTTLNNVDLHAVHVNDFETYDYEFIIKLYDYISHKNNLQRLFMCDSITQLGEFDHIMIWLVVIAIFSFVHYIYIDNIA